MNQVARKYFLSDWFIQASTSLLSSMHCCACSWTSSTHSPESTADSCCRIVAEQTYCKLAVTDALALDSTASGSA